MNADQALLRTFQVQQKPVAISSSALAEKLKAEILEVDSQIGRVTLGFEPDQFFCQAMNVLQGGAVASMLDYALAFAALAAMPDGYSAATASLTVCFVRPVQPGRLIATGIVDRVGKICAFARATLELANGGVIVANAMSPLIVHGPQTRSSSRVE